MCINSDIFLSPEKNFYVKKILNAQNHLKCPEKYFLGIFRKMHNMHILCIIMHILNFLELFRYF